MSYKEQINRGVELLDEEVGRLWYQQINLGELDMRDCYRCIRGQLLGDYYDPVLYYTTQSDEYGFTLDDSNPPRNDYEDLVESYPERARRSRARWDQLALEWKNKIEELRSERQIEVPD